MRKDLKRFIKDVRAAQRRAEIRAGTLTRFKSSTVPDRKKQQSRDACRGPVKDLE